MNRYSHLVAIAQMDAKSFHGGIQGLASVMGKNPIILAQKLNPANESNHLRLDEAAFIVDATQSPAIADALAALVNRVTVALPAANVSFHDLTREFCRLTKRCGNVGQELAEAQSPSSEWGEKISPAECKRIAKELRELLSVAAGLLQLVEG
ncbi:phage regulatory CII family protein [Chitinimonas sp. PSY-7]|uniref:phage regulatory CII family protein n=1 Tax=Chitinimonas sp. PSY-7 TaxID=3459088 RepID=UPI00403FF67C